MANCSVAKGRKNEILTFRVPFGASSCCSRRRPGKIYVVSRPLSPKSAPADHGRWPQSSFVAQLGDTERTALLTAGAPAQFADDAILVRQGDAGDGLYVLTSGMVKISVAAETGTETTLAVRSRGDLIGEFAVLDGMPRTATARAVGIVGAIRITRARFAAFRQQWPAAQGPITRSLVAKIRSATERHAAERTWGARERIAQVLFELTASYGEPGADGELVIPLPITQSELGELAGVAVSTTERILGELRKEGVIATRYREIAVRDMDVLSALRFSSQDHAKSITGGHA
jgi:CRP/FNR family transcriptional regulator, cyclic AMP receptor protein